MKNKTHLVKFTFVLLILTSFSFGSDVKRLISITHLDTQKIRLAFWEIHKSSIKWNPDDSIEPPITITNAIKAAKRLLVDYGIMKPKVTGIRLTEVSIGNWYYIIELENAISALSSVTLPIEVPVNMDGEVAETHIINGKEGDDLEYQFRRQMQLNAIKSNNH